MGLLGICDAISAYLHDLNLVSTAFRLLLAMTLSCIIGIDRGMKKRVAGVKTHVVVCLGATLIMMTGEYIHLYSNGVGVGDTARLGAQVISGVGFLGVGTIMVTGQRHEVSGLTTAASLWASAGIGLAVGIGFYSGAIMTAACIMAVFKYFKFVDKYVEQHSSIYEVYMEFENDDKMRAAIKKLNDSDIKVTNTYVDKSTKSDVISVQATLEAARWKPRNAVFREAREQDGVISVEEL